MRSGLRPVRAASALAVRSWLESVEQGACLGQRATLTRLSVRRFEDAFNLWDFCVPPCSSVTVAFTLISYHRSKEVHKSPTN